jgi:hypothetical protein
MAWLVAYLCVAASAVAAVWRIKSWLKMTWLSKWLEEGG